MKRQLLPGAIAGILIASGVAAIPAAQADGTPELRLTVDANITAGTCSVAVLEGESPTNTIAFGNVYISEVFAKAKVKPFKLRFSNCTGLMDKKATVTLAPRGENIGCAGSTTQNAEFSNASSSTTKAQKTGVEVWTTETPEGSGSVQFHCYNKNAQTVDLSGASATTPVDYPLSARMVPVGTDISKLTAGDFYSPTVFTVTYQ